RGERMRAHCRSDRLESAALGRVAAPKQTSILCLALVAALSVRSLDALDAKQFERILLPITVAPTPGAFRSMWSTDIWYRSDADELVQVYPLIVSDNFPGNHVTVPLQVPLWGPGHPPGQFLYVTRSLANSVHLNLRIFDTSRDALNFGTELP